MDTESPNPNSSATMGDSFRGSETDIVDYTEGEEKRAVRKVDLLVLPCIILMFLHLQFVRESLPASARAHETGPHKSG